MNSNLNALEVWVLVVGGAGAAVIVIAFLATVIQKFLERWHNDRKNLVIDLFLLAALGVFLSVMVKALR